MVAAAQVDDITDFTVADDQVGFDISDLETFESGGGASDLVNVSSGATLQQPMLEPSPR